MCVAVPLALAIAGTAVSAGGAVVSGYQQAAAARFQAAQADQNAQLAKQQAQQTQEQGAQDALNLARRTHALMGQQTVAFASQGLDVAFGTPADVIAGTSQLGAEDLTRLRQNVQDRSTSLLIQANNFSDTAAADRVARKNAITNGWLKAGGDILSGASQLAKPGLKIGGSGSVFAGTAKSGFTGSDMTGLY